MKNETGTYLSLAIASFTIALLYACMAMIRTNTNGSHDKEKPLQTSSLVEVYTDGNTTIVAGSMDDVYEWIRENEIPHVESIFGISRNELDTLRTLKPVTNAPPSVRQRNDTTEFLVKATIRKNNR